MGSGRKKHRPNRPDAGAAARPHERDDNGDFRGYQNGAGALGRRDHGREQGGGHCHHHKTEPEHRGTKPVANLGFAQRRNADQEDRQKRGPTDHRGLRVKRAGGVPTAPLHNTPCNRKLQGHEGTKVGAAHAPCSVAYEGVQSLLGSPTRHSAGTNRAYGEKEKCRQNDVHSPVQPAPAATRLPLRSTDGRRSGECAGGSQTGHGTARRNAADDRDFCTGGKPGFRACAGDIACDLTA